MSFTIGSLFDGSGGFPLAGFMSGGIPVWASEIEPYPIAVTTSRFPYVKHLGSVTDIKGDEIEPVDVITFGSPCQDLSVAGKRAGLKHEDNGDDETTRSGLFIEAVRIIREMREKTNGEYPRFAVWENVPGAFSSNRGEDFRIVLEELIKIAEPTAVMPAVPQKGWAYADSYSGNGWSIAYRVFDAQFWGVPQRRRRIYLVADFRGERAGEILFKRKGLRGYFAESGTPWKTVTGDSENCFGTTDSQKCYGIDHVITTGGNCTAYGECVYEDIQATLKAGGPHAVCYGISSYNSNGMLSDNPHSGIYEAETSRTLDLNGGNPACNQGGICVVENIPYTLKIRSGCEGGGKGALVQDDLSATLSTNNDQYPFQPVVYDARGNGDGATRSTVTGDHENRITDYTNIICCIDGDKIGKAEREGGSGLGVREGDKMYTLTAKDVHSVAYTMQGFGDYKDCGVCSGLKARDYKDATNLVVEKHQNIQYIVRRLTPTECARLQGFPDDWGHPDKKDDFTDEEYSFWLNVRNTHAEINAKQVKDYTKDQMLTWYNKLHTDSAEYKLWGNGIALPNALYVMQGIADALA